MPIRPGVDDDAAGQGAAGGFIAQNEMIAAQRQQRFGDCDLAEGRLFRLDLFAVAEDNDFTEPFGGAHMDAHALVIFKPLARARPDFQMSIEAVGDKRYLLMADDVAAGDLGAVGPGEIHRHALPPAGAVDRFAVDLQAAHAKNVISRQTAHLLADFDLAAQTCAGDHHAMSLQDKRAIHRQAKVAVRRGFVLALEYLGDLFFELRDALTGGGRDGDLRRILQHRAESQDIDLFADVVDAGRRHQIGLGDDEDSHLDAEQVNDVQVLFGLRHDAVVGGDGEKHQIDAVGSRQHVLDKALVAGHVDDAGRCSIGQIEMGKTEIDGYAAFFFFFEPIGVRAGERLDQAGFAVVDMAGGADDERHDSLLDFRLPIFDWGSYAGICGFHAIEIWGSDRPRRKWFSGREEIGRL